MGNNSSNAPFYIGQEVVCIENPDVNNRFEIYKMTPKIKKNKLYTVTDTLYCKAWNISDKKDWYVEVNDLPGEYYDYKMFAPVFRLRISDKLTIAEDLFKTKPVEERADVLIPETIKN